MKFFDVFAIRMRHSYYRDGRCLDCTLEATADTQRILRNHRCVVRSEPDGIRVLTSRSDARIPLIPIPRGARFAFSLRVHNPDFALFTDLSALSQVVAPLYTNAELGSGGNRQLVLKSRQVSQAVAPAVFAEVEILINDSLSNSTSGLTDFSIVFTAKQSTWVYYCVTDLDTAAAELRIVDTDTTPISFSDTRRLNLKEHPDPHDTIAATLGTQYPEMQQFRFVSDAPVVSQQAARKRLQLRLGDARLADALPNPSLRNMARMAASRDEIAQQDVLFHVIKYFSHVF